MCASVYKSVYLFMCTWISCLQEFMCSHVRVCSMVNNAQSSQSTTSLPLNVFTRPSRLTQTHTQHTRAHTHTHTHMYIWNQWTTSLWKKAGWMLRRVIHRAGRVLADTRHHQLPRVTGIWGLTSRTRRQSHGWYWGRHICTHTVYVWLSHSPEICLASLGSLLLLAPSAQEEGKNKGYIYNLSDSWD